MVTLLQQLVLETGLRESELRRIMMRAPIRYKTYTIKKRDGGDRLISQPAPEVKIVQRALSRILLNMLPVHEAATAYREGLSIRDNALPHAESGPILKMDFKEFFPSIRAVDWVSYCKRTGCITDGEELFLTSSLLFRRVRGRGSHVLAIGAPSSPVISNILMYEMDKAISEKVREDHIVYTRYAGDMTFSAPRTGHLVRTISDVAKIVRGFKTPSLELNAAKTRYITKKYGRRITGLTVSNDGEISIGHHNKRKTRAIIHKALLETPSQQESQVISGMLAYINAVDPVFMAALRKKYGDEAISSLQKQPIRAGRLEPHDPPFARR